MLAARLISMTPALTTGIGKTIAATSKNGLAGRSQCIRW